MFGQLSRSLDHLQTCWDMMHLQLYQLSATKGKSMCAFNNTGHGCLNGDIMCESSLLVGFYIFIFLEASVQTP